MPPTRAAAPQSTSESSCPGGRWPDTTVNECATPRWVTGMPAAPGTATGLGSPGITVTGTPASRQACTSSKPRPNTEAVAALEAHDPLPGPRPVDDHPVDLFLLRRTAAGQLRDVDQLDVRRELVEQLTWRQPVGHDDVGGRHRLPGGDGRERGSPGPPPTSTTPGVWSSAPDVVSRPSARAPRMSSRSAADWRGCPVCRHRDRHLPVPAGRRRPGGRLAGVVTADAEDAALVGSRRMRALTAGSVGGGDDVPGPVEVAVLELAQHQGDLAGHALERRRHLPGRPPTTSAPAATRAGTRRWATWPPPTTRTRRPPSRSPTGYGGSSRASVTGGILPDLCGG